jgi:hypothetical protein
VTTVSATTIAVSSETKDVLLRFGAEKESYDQVIKKFVGDTGWKELDARWNQIRAEDEFSPLDEL